MGWRDELTAARARIQVLEEENEALRRELERAQSDARDAVAATRASRATTPKRVRGGPRSPLWHSPWVAGLSRTPAKLAYVDALGKARLRIVALDGSGATDLTLAEHGRKTANRVADHIIAELEDGSLARIAWPSGAVTGAVRLGAALATPPLLRDGVLLCATQDHRIHRIDFARFELEDARGYEGGSDLKRLGFERARGDVLDLAPEARVAAAVSAALGKLDWSVRRAVVSAGRTVLALSRTFGSDFQWGIAATDGANARLAWVHEVGSGSPGAMQLVDGWLVALNVRSTEHSVVLAPDDGAPWLRMRGVWEDAHVATLDAAGRELARAPL